MIISRRKALVGLLGLVAAPAIVRCSSLMPIRKIASETVQVGHYGEPMALVGHAELIINEFGVITEVRIINNGRKYIPIHMPIIPRQLSGMLDIKDVHEIPIGRIIRDGVAISWGGGDVSHIALWNG